MSVKLSIALATYNGARYLPTQLESFRQQTRLPDELVVCDDGSTDDTVEVLHSFARTAPFEVRVVRNPTNLGHERNFGQAIDLCTGDVIFLADQDDAWYPEKLATVEGAFSGDPGALLVINDVLIADGALAPTGRTVLGQIRAAGVVGTNAKSLIQGCATAFRSRLRYLISPIPALNYGHDSWIHAFTEVLGGRRILPQVLQLYRRHENNASQWAFDSSDRASAAMMMKPTAGQDLSPQYAKRCRALRMMRDRLEALGVHEFAELQLDRSREAVLKDLDRSIAAVERRSDVFRRGWIGRKVLAMSLCAQGDYRYFLGWRSFLKDIVR